MDWLCTLLEQGAELLKASCNVGAEDASEAVHDRALIWLLEVPHISHNHTCEVGRLSCSHVLLCVLWVGCPYEEARE